MLLLLLLVSLVSGIFFYCQALSSGLGRRRWTVGGLIFGPVLWPMFCMQKRMKLNKAFGLDCLIFRA